MECKPRPRIFWSHQIGIRLSFMKLLTFSYPSFGIHVFCCIFCRERVQRKPGSKKRCMYVSFDNFYKTRINLIVISRTIAYNSDRCSSFKDATHDSRRYWLISRYKTYDLCHISCQIMKIIISYVSIRSGAPTTPPWACDATPCGGCRPSDSFLSRSEGLVHAEGAPTRFVVA